MLRFDHLCQNDKALGTCSTCSTCKSCERLESPCRPQASVITLGYTTVERLAGTDLLMHVHGAAEGKQYAGDHRARVPHKHGQVLYIHGHVTLTITPLAKGKTEGGPVDNQPLLLYVYAKLCSQHQISFTDSSAINTSCRI